MLSIFKMNKKSIISRPGVEAVTSSDSVAVGSQVRLFGCDYFAYAIVKSVSPRQLVVNNGIKDLTLKQDKSGRFVETGSSAFPFVLVAN